MMLRQIVVPAVFVGMLVSGCGGTPTMYRWGIYEGIVYRTYVEPEKADLETRIVQLSEDVQRTEDEGKRVPPGVYAHLGYLYVLQGDGEAAAEAFATERRRFPESSTFIDGLLKQLQSE